MWCSEPERLLRNATIGHGAAILGDAHRDGGASSWIPCSPPCPPPEAQPLRRLAVLRGTHARERLGLALRRGHNWLVLSTGLRPPPPEVTA
jgi:hypothetical protein